MIDNKPLEMEEMRTSVFVAALALTLVGASALGAEPSAKPEARVEAKPAIKPETKPETKIDAETKAQLEELEAKLNKILGATEPVKCYRLAGLADSQITVGITVELCGGSVDAAKTIQCFDEAFRSSDDGGLGLPRGLAVDLCKSRPQND